MAYVKHNFVSGTILYATQMKEIDDQVYVLTNDSESTIGRVSKLETNTATATNDEVAEMLARVLGDD